MTRGRARVGGAESRETPSPASARRRALTDAVDRLVGAAECLGAVPVDTGDVRALAVIVGAQARVVEALARLDTAEDRRRTGRVQRELLRARLATLSNASDAHGAVVVLPPLASPEGDPVDRLRARLAGAAIQLLKVLFLAIDRDDQGKFGRQNWPPPFI